MTARTWPAVDRFRSSWRRRPAWPEVVLGVGVLVQGVIALVVGSRGWFSGDVIHYFTERGGLPGGTEGLNEPHAGHWQPVLIAVYRVMFELFGLRTYLPYLALTVLVHLAVVVLLYAILVRLGLNRWTALVAALLVLTYGSGSEAFLVEAPVALTAALALGLVTLHVLIGGDFSARSVLVGNLVLLVAVMLSIGGVVAAVWVGCFALARGWRTMLATVALPAVSFVTWYLLAGRGGDRLYIRGAEWLEVPEAAATLLAQPFGDVVLAPNLGATLLVGAVVGALVGAARAPRLAALGLAGLLAAAVHAVLSSVAQVPFGDAQVLTSRYRYVVLVLLVPAAALAVQVVIDAVSPRVPDASRRILAVGAAALALGVLVNAAVDQRTTARLVGDAGDLGQTLLRGTLAAVSTGEVPINDATRGEYFSGFDLARLTEPEAQSEIPAYEVDQADRIAAESRFFVRVSDEPLAEDPDIEPPLDPASMLPSRLESLSFTTPLEQGPGCGRYLATSGTPSLRVTSYQGAAITVTSRAGTVTTTLVRDDLGVRGDPQTWDVDPGDTLSIATTAQVVTLEVGFDSGDYFEICAG
ncbi:hypothetical protein GCM10023340_34210 [Nocardioides marinquilinus]|uniref:Glycosyltransferase RgtA/B/C/D-like domain-containing protein n=1 Tax=Nocardioides marinquilinus TaxID=1210400 RepID=A0ABP9PWZ5_9ACTN